MDFLYARTVLELLNDVVKENCYGCEVNHPSQVHHTCLMWTSAEHLDVYFDLAFNKIKQEDMVKKFKKEVEIMDIPVDYKNNVLNQFEEWCNNHKPNPESVWQTTLRMHQLENRFEEEYDF